MYLLISREIMVFITDKEISKSFFWLREQISTMIISFKMSKSYERMNRNRTLIILIKYILKLIIPLIED